MNKQLQHQTNEIQSKLDEANRTLNDFDATKKKLAVENADLLRQVEEAESQISQLSKLKLSLTNQLDDNRKLADDECRVSTLNKSISINAKLYDHFLLVNWQWSETNQTLSGFYL